MNENERFPDNRSLERTLMERERTMADYLVREREMVEEAFARRAERVRWWESMVSNIKQSAHAEQLNSYRNMAGSLAGLLGASIKDQAKIMIPFEVAEATKEFARFLGTRDPSALASSLKHTLAAKQYAAAAKAASPSGAKGGGAGAGGGKEHGRGKEREEKTSRVVVNVGRQVGMVDTYEFARNLIDAINENVSDDVVLEVAS
ncbi:MAG: hypothetical protein R6V10_02240 [bacterium]